MSILRHYKETKSKASIIKGSVIVHRIVQVVPFLDEKVDVENDIDNLTEEDWEKLATYDRVIANYSDGHFSKLYRAYAEKYKDDFVL